MYDDLKFDLCCGARILHRAGLSTGIGGHLSIKVDRTTMIANPFSPSLGIIAPKDLLTLDFEGNVLDGDGIVNDTILLHGVIHKLHPDILAVAHTHPPAVVTLSAFRILPELYDQEGCFLVGDIGILEEDYSGLASREDRIRPVAAALNKFPVVILPNHGAITRAKNIRLAIVRMMILNAMAQRHLVVTAAARAMGLAPTPIAPETALATKKELMEQTKAINAIDLVWDDLVAKLRRTDADLFTEGLLHRTQ